MATSQSSRQRHYIPKNTRNNNSQSNNRIQSNSHRKSNRQLSSLPKTHSLPANSRSFASVLDTHQPLYQSRRRRGKFVPYSKSSRIEVTDTKSGYIQISNIDPIVLQDKLHVAPFTYIIFAKLVISNLLDFVNNLKDSKLFPLLLKLNSDHIHKPDVKRLNTLLYELKHKHDLKIIYPFKWDIVLTQELRLLNQKYNLFGQNATFRVIAYRKIYNVQTITVTGLEFMDITVQREQQYEAEQQIFGHTVKALGIPYDKLLDISRGQYYEQQPSNSQSDQKTDQTDPTIKVRSSLIQILVDLPPAQCVAIAAKSGMKILGSTVKIKYYDYTIENNSQLYSQIVCGKCYFMHAPSDVCMLDRAKKQYAKQLTSQGLSKQQIEQSIKKRSWIPCRYGRTDITAAPLDYFCEENKCIHKKKDAICEKCFGDCPPNCAFTCGIVELQGKSQRSNLITNKINNNTRIPIIDPDTFQIIPYAPIKELAVADFFTPHRSSPTHSTSPELSIDLHHTEEKIYFFFCMM